MTPRDQLLQAEAQLRDGAQSVKRSSAFCRRAADSVRRLAQTVQPRDDGDHSVKEASSVAWLTDTTLKCIAHAGDCGAALKLWRTTDGAKEDPGAFPTEVPACKRWWAGHRGSSRRR